MLKTKKQLKLKCKMYSDLAKQYSIEIERLKKERLKISTELEKYRFNYERKKVQIEILLNERKQFEENFKNQCEISKKLEKEKKKAVNACKKYRKIISSLYDKINILNSNLDTLTGNYIDTEEQEHKLAEINMLLSGKLQAYERTINNDKQNEPTSPEESVAES